MVIAHKENFVSVIETLENKFLAVFDNGLCKLPEKLHLQVHQACEPVILPARKVPISVKEKVKAEL